MMLEMDRPGAARIGTVTEEPASEPSAPARVIAFYLPQYHPIAENDVWWGKGFTEWTNVVKARPLFKGHYQPHLPADLGFYDLRLSDTREAQAELAREYGIHGFCYYHYWFNGRRLLERPFNEVLAAGRPDFPFCLCWANENWTRTWGGDERSVLMPQAYGADDDRAHIRTLLKAFDDRRYIRIDGKPLFMVYRISQLPEPRRTAEIWREEAHRAGIGELFLGKVESYQGENYGDPAAIGFDAGIQFAPDSTCAGFPKSVGRWLRQRGVDEFSWKVFSALESVGTRAAQALADGHFIERGFLDHSVFDYDVLMKNMLARETPAYRWYPCVTPSWDNTARRQKGGKVYEGASPAKYEGWLTAVIQRQLRERPRDRVVFVNAWNEWGEGNHLEPCMKYGRAYLEATARAVTAGTPSTRSA